MPPPGQRACSGLSRANVAAAGGIPESMRDHLHAIAEASVARGGYSGDAGALGQLVDRIHAMAVEALEGKPQTDPTYTTAERAHRALQRLENWHRKGRTVQICIDDGRGASPGWDVELRGYPVHVEAVGYNYEREDWDDLAQTIERALDAYDREVAGD